MSLELALLIGFLFHLIGDYVTQNDWLAQNKTKDWNVAFIHACIYSVPFAWLVSGNVYCGYQLFIIMITHALIDHYRLAVYWIKLVNWNWSSTNYGFSDKTPAWLSTWLLIIVDNIFHIIINSACIVWSFQYHPSPSVKQAGVFSWDQIPVKIEAGYCYFLTTKTNSPFPEVFSVVRIIDVRSGFARYDYVSGHFRGLDDQIDTLSYFSARRARPCDCPDKP
ncbi:DUF3307 domain-containing protein [Fibrella aestuarina]|uniref:DUF3307 domain-containing protein n=1 Tax=Fibrella aestuarina TaxID=651143 RepID=UPI0006861BF3|nr:DUF3307 domain-containing protein [Fibrella aestuarina]